MNFFKVFTLTPWDSLNSDTLTEIKLFSLKNIFKTFPVIEPEFIDDLLSKLYKFKQYSWIECIKRIVGPNDEDYDITPWNFVWGMDNERRIYQLLLQKTEDKRLNDRYKERLKAQAEFKQNMFALQVQEIIDNRKRLEDIAI